jgi:hypothetical protein
MYCRPTDFKYLITFTIISIVALVLIMSIEFVQTADARCLGDLSGIWSGDDSGTYYIQQNGNKIWWIGAEHFNGGASFANVFFGQRSGDSIKGDWADVPLGNAKGNGHLTLLCSQNAHNYILTKTSGSGGFGGSTWEKRN